MPDCSDTQMMISVLDIAPYPGNNWDDGTGTSDPYTIVRVQVAQRQIAAVVPGI